jgi:hypothetical protein
MRIARLSETGGTYRTAKVLPEPVADDHPEPASHHEHHQFLSNWYAEHMQTPDRDFVRHIINYGKVNLTHLPAAYTYRTTYNVPSGGAEGDRAKA